MNTEPTCVQCGKDLSGSYHNRKYCSFSCKAKWRKAHPSGALSGHHCRVCGTHFPIAKGQYNKWLCSDKCRRASIAKSVREFHHRRPSMSDLYRTRTKAKCLPEGNLVRFRKTNPQAPMACESCGENRVLDVAHKPGFERNGYHRSSKNCVWPAMVWVLCPTCHALIDRMHYPPHELGLTS